ncbi:glycosyltransferase [Achromobacter sp. RTa]|uniref:glycosyltransferase family protein n=1 Tax=Achromobacter sp. RTa TaxID=1532557 RepID=UPI0009DED271|nr:glycosyltransferase [Achromobacter sp. RTa]
MSAVLTMQQRGWEAYAGKLGVDVMQKTQKCLDWICSQVEGEYVLDADCGQAAILMLLAREGKAVVGLCSRSAALTQASSFIGEEPAQVQRNITLQTGSLQSNHTLIDRTFDTVLLPQSLIQEEHPGDHVELAFRKLKPGGRLISLWPFGALAPSGAGYYLREPMKLLARHFETLEVRLFGDVLVIVANARLKVLERLPAPNAWPDSLIQEAESTVTQLQQASKGQLHAAQSQAQELRHELEQANAQLAELIRLQAEHETQAATLKAQLDSIQHAERDSASIAQNELRQLKTALKESQEAAVTSQHAAAHAQAQARILELEKVQEIAVLRYEKLQRETAMREAQQDAELKIAEAKAEVSGAAEALTAARQELDKLRQRFQDAEATSAAREEVFGKRIEELQQSLNAKQEEIAEGKSRIDELVATVSQRESAILKLDEEIAELRDAREALAAEKQQTDARIIDIETAAQQTAKALEQEREQAKRRIDTLEASIAESAATRQSMAQTQAQLQADNKSMEWSLKTLNNQLSEARTTQRNTQAASAQEIQQLQKQLAEAQKRVDMTAAQLKEAQMKGREFVTQFRESQSQEKEAVEKIRHLERRIRNLEQQKAQALLQVEQTRKTLSFQLGYALLHAFKSWSSFIGLPGELIRIHKDGKERRKRKLLKQTGASHASASVKATPRAEPKVAPQASIVTPASVADFLLQQQKLKVAGIMDEFTFHSYAPECELLQLRPEDWRTQVDDFQPDLVFIESAWKGVDDSWKGIISNCTDEITGLLAHCRAKGIPSIFWNKEDPVHFSTFIPVAGLVDHVFTTDVDCLPKYKAALGHDRVSLLPFAAQPKTHNPIEKFDRKDAFNFAGSYYLRYPERQRDFAALIDTVSSLKPVEIYDRNYDKPHPHYEFPEKYSSMILGSLPFSEIDKAYKGYRYGVNMNTIKQSQTMYARRVFELLASNTVVVSNFSRGVRVMFGDLVVCSDDADQIRTQLEPICADEVTYRKFRLQGLRKVMSQHTYRQRVQYIKAKLAGQPVQEHVRSVLVVAYAKNAAQRDTVIDAFSRQHHAAKTLYIVSPTDGAKGVDLPGVHVFSSVGDMTAAVLASQSSFELIGGMHPQAYYGAHYLMDLALAREYSDAAAYTKAAHYVFEADGNLILKNDGKQYRASTNAAINRSLYRISSLSPEQLQHICAMEATQVPVDALAIDEFNYCDLPPHTALPLDAQQRCSDLAVRDSGASFYADLIPIAEKIKNTPTSDRNGDNTLPRLTAQELHAVLPAPASKQIQMSLKDGKLNIRSTMPPDKFAYLYAKKIFTRDELNLVLNSHFEVVTSDSQEIRSVFEFQDQAGKKIAHQMNPIGGGHTLAIPPNCVKIRLGFRIQGNGSGNIEALVLGSHGEPPATLVSRSQYLVLTKQYPAYDDLYRYGFLHSRVRSYREAGLDVDVFRLTNLQETPYREFEGIDVVSGDLELLDQTLASGQYKKVLVHLLDEKMWSVLEKHLDKVKVDIWVHGAEIQVWQRREFEFERMSKDEVTRQKKLSDKRVKFWKRVLQPQPHPNVHLIFVSQYFADEVAGDLGVKLPDASYSIIHNYIDSSIFAYHKKSPSQRLKLLSIRPYASRKYANDLTVNCILELSRRPYFAELQFNLYGDGDLFDDVTKPVSHFENVHLHKRFLSQREIAEVHTNHGIFLTPTRMDAQGVSRDEAMSSGLVPITNSVAAIPEFVDAACGYLAPAEDSIAMANAIEEMYKNPQIFLDKSERASARVAAQCGFDNTIKQELAILAGTHRGRPAPTQ